jgi:hypothetical protein
MLILKSTTVSLERQRVIRTAASFSIDQVTTQTAGYPTSSFSATEIIVDKQRFREKCEKQRLIKAWLLQISKEIS